MALIKCPDCGKMVSDKAAACPDCGCPNEFFLKTDEREEREEIEKPENEEERQITTQIKRNQQEALDEKIIFQFAGQKFEYSKQDSYFINVIGQYLVMAEMIEYMAGKAYDQFGGIGEVLRNFPVIMNGFLQEKIYNMTTECLYRLGDSLSIEQFIRKYNNRYTMQYESYYSKTVEQYAEIRQESARLAEYRRAVKDSRARWTGGGFGLKGAVKGAVTAGMLNCGSDFLHSFADAADERRDNQEIQRKLKELYCNFDTKNNLTGGMRACVLNIMYALQDEMESIGAVSSKIEINRGKAVALYNNTMKWEKDEATLYKNLAQCISYYPVLPVFYHKIEPAILTDEAKDISSFIEFWGFHDVISNFTNVENAKNVFDNWELKNTIEAFYEKYRKYLPSGKVKEEKEKALACRKHRSVDKLQFADNIRRRFGSLMEIMGISEGLINTPLYMIRSEFRPTFLMRAQETDQYIFLDNEEIIVTDYELILRNETIPLAIINEVWYGEADRDCLFAIRIFLKNHQETIDTNCNKDSTVKILTCLNIALEPYRELGYLTAFELEMLDMYIELHNCEEILEIDSEEDKANKKKIEAENKKRKAEEMERARQEKWSEEERRLSESVKRRFQPLLELCNKDLDCAEYIVNRFLYELEIENFLIPPMVRDGDCASDEFIFYADDVFAITDYRFAVAENQHFSFKLSDINEVYYAEYDTLAIIQKEGHQSNKIKAYESEKHFKPEILFFLNIVLEPYREIGYISEIHKGGLFHYPLSFLRKFEKENGDFGDYITEKLDDDTDREKKRIIKAETDKRAAGRKSVADSYRKNHSNPIRDKFSDAFASLYLYLYAKCEDTKGDNKDVKYLTGYRNHYDYEIYECLTDKAKKLLDDMAEKGLRILWCDDNILLTDWNINIEGNVFSLYDIKEITTGLTIQADEADSYDDWIDSDERYVIEFRSGRIQVLKSKAISISDKVWYPLNHALKSLHNIRAENHFLQKETYFCERCNSFHITKEDGFLGKKYKCIACNNKSKRKILVLEHDQNAVIDDQAVTMFILHNKLDLNFEPAAPIQIPPMQAQSIQAPPMQAQPMQVQLIQAPPIQAQQIRDFILCNHCGMEIAAGAKYCTYCGKMIEQTVKTVKMKFCVYCGKQIIEDIKFCNFCGSPNTYRKNEVEKSEM